MWNCHCSELIDVAKVAQLLLSDKSGNMQTLDRSKTFYAFEWE
jgi:hypothetical protein